MTIMRTILAFLMTMLGLEVQAQPITPVKVGSLTHVGTAPANSVLLLTIPGVTNYVIAVQNFSSSIAGLLPTNTLVISNIIVTNLTVINNIDFAGHNAAVGYVWTCTNATTGAGEWQAVPISGTGLTNLIFSSQVFTNNGMFIYRNGYTPSNNASFLIRSLDGSRFYGSNAWADPFDYWHKTTLFPYQALNYSTSNDYNTIVGEMYSKDWLNGTCFGINRNSTFSDGASAYSSSLLFGTQGGSTDQWYMLAHPNFGSIFSYTSNSTVWFSVSNGDLVTIKAVNYSWPSANAAGALTDDGSGNLSWTAIGSVAVTNIGGGTNISIRVSGGTNFIDTVLDPSFKLISISDTGYFYNIVVTNLAQVDEIDAGTLVVTNDLQAGSAHVAGTTHTANLDVTNCPPSTNEVVVLSGTNVLVEVTRTNQTNFYKVNSTGGGGGVTNFGAIVTNVAYTTNFITDFANIQNDYYMTNMMANHICVYPTNMFDGLSWTMNLTGTNIYTNLDVYFTWPPSVNVTWLSITNGAPITWVTSNKVQFYSFKCRTSSITTNVIAAFKEQP